MSHPKLLSRSVACAVIVMSLSQLLNEPGGRFILVPGMMFDALLTVIIMILSRSDYYPVVRLDFPFSFIFYSACFYAASCLYVCLKESYADDSVIQKR